MKKEIKSRSIETTSFFPLGYALHSPGGNPLLGGRATERSDFEES